MTFSSSLTAPPRSLGPSASDRLPNVYSSKINKLATLGLGLCHGGPCSLRAPSLVGEADMEAYCATPHQAKNSNGGIHPQLGVSTGRSVDHTRGERWGSGRPTGRRGHSWAQRMKQSSRPKPVCVGGVGGVWGRDYLRQGRPRLRDSDQGTSDSGSRLQRWAGQTTEKPRLEGQLRSLA